MIALGLDIVLPEPDGRRVSLRFERPIDVPLEKGDQCTVRPAKTPPYFVVTFSNGKTVTAVAYFPDDSSPRKEPPCPENS